MFQGVSVASRTRSKKGRVVGSGLMMGWKRRRTVDEASVEVIYLESSSESEGGENAKNESGCGVSSAHSDAFMENGFEFLGEEEDEAVGVVEINDDGDGGDAEEEMHCEKKTSEGKVEVESKEGEGCSGFGVKNENFGDDECGVRSDIPIVMLRCTDDDWYGYVSSSSSSESEDDETSDEDFRVDDAGDGVESENSISEESDSSYDNDGDEREAYSKMVKERVSKVDVETESSGVWRRKGEKKCSEQVREVKQWIGADCASVTFNKSEIRKEETKRAEEKYEAKIVESVNVDAEVVVDHCQSSGYSMPYQDAALEDEKKGDRGHQSVSLQKETEDSTVVKKSGKNKNVNNRVDLDEHEGKEHHHDNGKSLRGVSSLPKIKEKIGDSAEVVIKENKKRRKPKDAFTECFGGKHDSVEDDSNGLEKMGDDVDQSQTQPSASSKTAPLISNSKKAEPVERSESEKEINILWNEMDVLLQEGGNKIGDSTVVKKSETHNIVNDKGTGVRRVSSLPKSQAKIGVLISNFKKAEPVERSESEKEINILWNEMDMLLQDGGNKIGDSTVVKKSETHNIVNDKGTGVRRVSSLPKSQAKIGVSAKVVIDKDKKEMEHKYGFNSNNRENKVRTRDDELYEVLRRPSITKDRGFKFFTECFWGKQKDDDDFDQGELKESDGAVDQGQTQPIASRETVPLKFDFRKKKCVEKSESEKELDMLWGEMDMVLRTEEIESQVGNIGTTEARENEESNNQCKHDIIYNEEIGMFCRWCGWIETDIKYMWPKFVDSERSGRRVSSSEGNTSRFDEAMFNGSGDDTEAVGSHNDGTVWDLIPDVTQSLYPHQQEGFEFIWTNLAGTTDLAKLKGVDPRSEGGCIISHAPGTGKTRLTMVFLQTYLQLFPKCLPVIVAPANILLTWEDELRKWNIGIPFHNFNNAELSGKEQAINEVDWSGNQKKNKDAIRMVKLCSWYKEKSILLISYNLFEKLAGGKSDIDGEKKKKNKKMKKEKKHARIRKYIERAMGKVLHDCPGLLVLDEGHTPRNQQSCIWKVLSKSRTQKRILLSGTPFQNNFLELYNILCLMKPSFPDSLPQELKKFCQSRLMQVKKASSDINWEPLSFGNSADEKINQLKLLMNPFVHVHKGSILQKNLPGLRDCVLVLKPDGLQQETLESIECSQNVLNFEHKLALVSVHPSLFLNCSLSKKEESVVDKDQLEKLRLKPYEGVKTKFLLEFVRLCDASNEKVLVFSQFIDTLVLIKDQLESAFKWSVGTEVLYMYGRLDQKQKQTLIHSFNDANSQAKVLLASIKASSEGINLIGASRVVLLDVVWNPSVERQAICRAYRLGQKRVVYTYHLLAQGTPECTKYCKQAEKNWLSELVFSNRNAESDKLNSCGVIFEDRVLDIMVQHEDLKDMFGECLVQPKERDLETLGQ